MKKVNHKRGLKLLKESIASLKLARAFLFVDQLGTMILLATLFTENY